MTDNGEEKGPPRMDAYIVYRQAKGDATGVPVSVALVTSEAQARMMNAQVEGVYARLAVDCPTEHLVRVGIVAIVGILGQIAMQAGMLMQMAQGAQAPVVDPRSVRARGQ